ncbi:MAG: phosphatase PAP2 family protein [Flavobacteriaceae bacterium]|nr:phosphatase PAP2 family protein [Flavobacteriaceae bacterium]
MKEFLFFIVVLYHLFAFGQKDTLNYNTPKNEKSFLHKSIVPIALIGTGLIINYSNGSIGKENLQRNILKNFPDFKTNADDFLLFVPVITMYTADIFKVKSKNDAFTQTKYLAIAGLTNSLITIGIKTLTKEMRPDGSDNDSFPSGHTSNAFVMATVLHHEFIDTNPWLAFSGYLFATTTGVFRVLNNKHWVSDVLVGAGIGIIVTDLVYRLEPLKNWNPFNKGESQLILSPTYTNNKFGLYANLQF